MTFPPLEGTDASRAVFLDASKALGAITFEAASGEALVNYVKGSSYSDLRAIDLENHGIFVAIKADGSSVVMQAAGGPCKILHEWSDVVDSPHYSGFVDRDGIVHVSRYTISKVLWVGFSLVSS
jgi:hypothetical protein